MTAGLELTDVSRLAARGPGRADTDAVLRARPERPGSAHGTVASGASRWQPPALLGEGQPTSGRDPARGGVWVLGRGCLGGRVAYGARPPRRRGDGAPGGAGQDRRAPGRRP